MCIFISIIMKFNVLPSDYMNMDTGPPFSPMSWKPNQVIIYNVNSKITVSFVLLMFYVKPNICMLLVFINEKILHYSKYKMNLVCDCLTLTITFMNHITKLGWKSLKDYLLI